VAKNEIRRRFLVLYPCASPRVASHIVPCQPRRHQQIKGCENENENAMSMAGLLCVLWEIYVEKRSTQSTVLQCEPREKRWDGTEGRGGVDWSQTPLAL